MATFAFEDVHSSVSEITVNVVRGSLGHPQLGAMDINREAMACAALAKLKIDRRLWSDAVEPHLVDIVGAEPWHATRCGIMSHATLKKVPV
jgi:hypothetical protein